MLPNNQKLDQDLWKKKAVAFVTRSHRHLWGKNNEDPLAFLFLKGLENQFVKEMVIGWNKFGQERPKENWGLKNHSQLTKKFLLPSIGGKFFLPSGIVIPYIVNKELISVYIIPMLENGIEKPILVPGSQSTTMIFNKKCAENNQSIIVIENILDGLTLLQETQRTVCIVIYPAIDKSLESEQPRETLLEKQMGNHLLKSNHIQYFFYIKDRSEPPSNRFKDFSNVSYHPYQSNNELLKVYNGL